ncbi:EAL domain-containing protein [Catenovulum maritimum]|uniref:Diguanylate cyclase n=1 Tax=Catenovulum maritimum TaxID=1513271 RepID=A0A0J8GWP1_9ALTE|nr:EAL domain-containing protein [Catenovulum maritimum]KMT65709.1 hypothetical protein XM47_08450 [Catenovulum maritimum]
MSSHKKLSTIGLDKKKQLKKLLRLRKQAEHVQKTLLSIAELSSADIDIDTFYHKIHLIISELMLAPNLYLVIRDPITQKLEIPYYSDLSKPNQKLNLPNGVIEFGLTGYVLRNKAPLLCDQAKFNQLVEEGEVIEIGSRAHSWIGVPLTRNGLVVGALVVQSYQTDLEFSAQDLAILQFVSQHIIHAIDRVEQKQLLESEIKSRTLALHKANVGLKSEILQKENFQQAQKLLLDLTERHDFSLPFDSLLTEFSLVLSQLIKVDAQYVTIFNRQSAVWEVFNSDPPVDLTGHVAAYRSVHDYLLIDPCTLLLEGTDCKKLAELKVLHLSDSQINHIQDYSWLAAPINIDGNRVALLAMLRNTQTSHFDSHHIELLEYVSNHFSVIIDKWHAQQTLHRSNQELEKLVLQRTEALNLVNSDLHQQIEARKKVQAQLYHDANHDSLTGLPNRQLFNRKLMHTVGRSKQDPDFLFSVLFIDLDRFKLINDTFGHLTGDKFLVEVSQRISDCLHHKDILARLGGDEFVILLQGKSSIHDPETVAQNIIDALNVSFFIDEHEIYAGCSIGITGSEYKYQRPADVLRDADAAMYQAKNLGRGRYIVFDESLHQALIAQLELETDLRRALKENQFEFEFEPIINVSSDEIVAIEALVRWPHPVKGKLKPKDFLQLAYDTGLIFDIDLLALEQACNYLENAKNQANKYLVSVNISGKVLLDGQKFNQLLIYLNQSKVNLHHLILEFSELSLTEVDKVITAFAQLSELGVRIAIDDFGAAAGAMSLLFNADIDFVKLDQSLIKSITTSVQKQRYAEHIVQIGQQVGYITIAEGIENEQMLANANQIGCLFAQGKHIQNTEGLNLQLENHFNKSRKLAI